MRRKEVCVKCTKIGKKLNFFQENLSKQAVLSDFTQNHGTYMGDMCRLKMCKKLHFFSGFWGEIHENRRLRAIFHKFRLKNGRYTADLFLK